MLKLELKQGHFEPQVTFLLTSFFIKKFQESLEPKSLLSAKIHRFFIVDFERV